MAKPRELTLLYLLIAFVMQCHSQERKVHVVYMRDKPREASAPYDMHCSMLERILGSTEDAKESLIYCYGRSFNGFAAKLSDEEVVTFSEMEEVVSVIPNTMFELHKTRSWNILGFNQSHVRSSQVGDAIIGIIDSGIWPESEGFSDKGFGPPPAKWKGTCQTNYKWKV